MEIIATVLVMGAVVGVGVSTVAAYGFGKRQREAQIVIWDGVAQRLGGRLDAGHLGLFRHDPCSIEAEIEGACVFVDTFVLSSGKTSTTYTRVRAQFVMPAGPSYRVYREHLLSSFGKALGFQDVEIGQPMFDHAFMVKADDPAAVAEAWSEEACEQMLALDSWSARSDGNVITLQRVDVEVDEERLESAMRLAATLAQHGVWLLRGMGDAVPGARYLSGEGPWDGRSSPVIEIDRGARTVRVMPVVHRGWPLLCARLELSREYPHFEVRITAAGDMVGGMPSGVLPAEAPALLREVGPSDLHCDGASLRLYLKSIDPDINGRVDAAATLLTEMAGGSLKQGAFR